MRSADGGASWTRLADGLASPSATTAVAFAGSRLFASDETGVYEWTGRAWQRRWAQKLVVRLDAAGQDLFASSSDGSLGVFTAGRWRPLAGARAAHGHGHQGEQSVLLASGRLYASAAAGVVASADAGRTWITLGGGLPAGAGQLTGYHGWLWAATASGVYCYPLAPAARPATPPWWLFLATAALLAGLASIAITATRGAPAGRRARPRHARY
jgi:hypothetical protein